MTTTPVPTAGVASTQDPTGVVRIRTVAVALAAGAVTSAGLLAAQPWGDRLDTSADDVLAYDTLQEVRGAAWAGMLVDGFAYAVVAVTVGLAVVHLAPSRGRVAALVGAVLTTAGGILFAMGAGAFATFSWFATAPGLSEGAGRSLVDYANGQVPHLLGPNMAGFAVYTLGSLVLAAAVIRARAVPLAAVALFVLGTLAQFVLPEGNDVLDYVQIGQMVLLVGLATVVWRRA
jgi:hypothetical protein